MVGIFCQVGVCVEGVKKKTTAPRQPAQWLQASLWWLALMAGFFPIAFRQVSVSDAWWHVALGKWLVEERSAPDLSRFYFSPWDASQLWSELRWQWLGDITLYFCHALLGAFGLQMLVVACMAGAAFFLVKLGSGQAGGWMLLLVAAVCLGTYQLQMPRNSLFSLFLYPAVLWLGCRQTGAPSAREYLSVGLVLVLWSCVHGSCVLGWVTAAAIFGTRSFSAFRSEGQWQLKKGIQSLALCALCFGITLMALVAGRHGAMHFLALPARHVASAMEVQPVAQSSESLSPAPIVTAKKSANLKEWLNSSIWKQDPAVPWSNDYWSPLDMLPGMKPIEAAYALAALALIAAIAFRNIPLGLLLAWLGAVFLGLGYVRMFGYTALASGAVIVVALKQCGWPGKRWARIIGWVLACAWLVFAWWIFFTGKVDAFIPEGQHVSRIGKVAIYDDDTADWVKREFPDERVFTTIETGSYCLLRWNFEKPVFLDGFFAPHTKAVWDAYHAALRKRDLKPLEKQFDIRLAIVPTTSPRWVERFKRDRNWNAIAVGAGSVVFAHESISLQGRSPRIFLNAGDLRKSSYYFREAALKAFFQIATSESKNTTGFRPQDWTSQPAFQDLRSLAREVFPRM